MEIITLQLPSGTEINLIIDVLKSSDVLYSMATSKMKEGEDKKIIFTDEDPEFAIKLYCQLSSLLYIDPSFKIFYDRDEAVIRLRKFTEIEVGYCVMFWDKYQVKEELWKCLKATVAWHITGETFCMLDKYVPYWHPSTLQWISEDDELGSYYKKMTPKTLESVFALLVKNRKRKRDN